MPLRDKLVQAIEHPKQGSQVLLHANDFLTANEKKAGRQAVFELSSRAWQEEFLSLWPIFEDRELFEECLRAFAKLALTIQDEKPYSHIITCTQTSKYLMDRVHSLIETRENRVRVHYIGNYPFVNLENHELLSFHGESVLVITDVVATGKLIENLIQVVKKGGGKTVGILCVFLANEKYIGNKSIIEYQAPLGNTELLRIYSLCEYPLDILGSEPDNYKIIQIDPEAVYPKTPRTPHSYAPLFDTMAMYRHFDDVKALEFSFFYEDRRAFTSGVRFESLLGHSEISEEIWLKIKTLIPENITETFIATTCNSHDVLFKNFIEDRLSKNYHRILVPKKGAVDSPANYFLFPKDIEDVGDNFLIICLR
jgi:hypothetical protein